MREWSEFYKTRAHTELAKQSGWMYQCLPIVLYCNLLPILSAINFDRYL
jgi:hypothetical protein